MSKLFKPKKPFILVNEEHGVRVFPRIGFGGCAEITSEQSETPVFDERDNGEFKARYWSMSLGRQFNIQPLCAS